MNISQEKAACALFYEQYNEEKGKQLLEKIRELGPFKICYNIKDDFRQPLLLHENTIHGSPYKTYNLYGHKHSDIEKFDISEEQLNKQSCVSEEEDNIPSKPKEDKVKLLLCILSAVLLFLVVGLVTNEFPIVQCKLNHFNTKKQ